jgi:hypothetical protein
MKRFAPFITCCYLCSLFLPLTLRANVLPVSETTVTGAAADDYYKSSRAQLKVLSSNKVGQTLVASEALSSTAALSGLVSGAAGIAGVAYYERTGKDPVYAAFDAVATAADALFVPAYQAFKASFVSPESYPASAAQYVGVEGSVGAKLGDIVDFVKSSANGLYDDLKNLLSSNSSPSPLFIDEMPPVGSIIEGANGAKFVLGSSWNRHASVYDDPESQIVANGYLPVPGWSGAYWKPNSWLLVRTNDVDGYAPRYWYNSQWPTVVTDGTPVATPESALNYPGLKSALQSPSPQVSAEIKEAIKNLPADQKITSSDPAPETVPSSSPQPITNTQIQNFFAQNTTNVYNKTLETITNNATSTTTEITNEVAGAAAEAAKAQEEEATKETEETFSPISDSAFEEPYNPGEFDIPARFTQFLNNVKSSGLFSFSNDFFNSLPGGGSSVYEIEAGQYGHHTIDLSATLSTGLAVLKTILLVCFGFLSIRAVIMKR